MLRGRSIRFRLTFWYAAVLTAGLALFGALTWLLLRDRLIAELDRGMEVRTAQFESFFRVESAEAAGDAQLRDELGEFCQAVPAASSIRLRGSDGFSFVCGSAALPGELRFLRKQFTFDGVEFKMDAAVSADAPAHTLALLRVLLLSLLPLVVVVACIGGFWLSGRALRPVNDIAAAALTISIENLSERVPVPATGDDLARLAEILNTMLARLDGAVTTLSQFVADASHELRTPLAVIRTTAELALRKDRSAESYRISLQQIVAEATHMTELVENLLLLARADAAVDPLPMGPVDLREVLLAISGELRAIAGERQVRIVTQFGEGDAWVSGNRVALHRAFTALVDNAIKFSHAGREVQIGVAFEEGGEHGPCVTIQDFGPGIDREDLPHIFKRFYRSDRSRTSPGYGLGLSLVESIIAAHAASINVSSDVSSDQGTRFSLRFPITDPQPTAPDAKTPFSEYSGSPRSL